VSTPDTQHCPADGITPVPAPENSARRFDIPATPVGNIFSTAGTPTLPPLIPLPEAAQLLGIPRASAYRYAQAGMLPVKRFGRRVYVITAKLGDLFESMPDGRDAA